MNETNIATTKDTEQDPRAWYDMTLVQALCVVVLAAGIIVSIGLSFYLRSDKHKYDINRPGNKYNSPQLSISENTAIDTTSPVTKEAIGNMTDMIKDQLNKLQPYSNYSDQGLDDATLGLKSPKPNAPVED